MKKRKIAVLISGRGSNLQALIDACRNPDYPAAIAAVISNKADAYGLVRAQSENIPTHVLNHRQYTSRENFDEALHETLLKSGAEFVCLAGFMRLLTAEFVKKWEGKLINIHPSLLPSFKGAHAHEDAVRSGVKISGCTVHFVIPEMDAGPIIAQAAVPVLPEDTAETLGARVLEAEHRCYPMALSLLLEGKVAMESGKAVFKEFTPAAGILLNPVQE